MEKIRQPAVAGRFYTANPTDLAAEVRSFLGLAPGDASGQRSGAGGSHINRREGGQTLGMLLPHAGYIFSGAVAGLTLRELLNEPGPLPDLFVLLGPSHTGRGAPLAVWPDGAWR
ncbi:MAG: AmmeMemoRadiSam system protein B, partial [Deltaproteobacteria bacterium]|nr:AmmeMemoRadiSam system protein B [Deltaproteobacteria bacterium]